jgi:hypothetical protein
MDSSQASQFSDVYASSSYDLDTTDTLHCLDLIPDNVIPNLSFSQQSFTSASQSVTDSDFLRPQLVVPSCLRHVCPDRINTYILYSEMVKDEYLKWWLQTDYGRKKFVRWDSRHQAEVWKHFDQVAKLSDGIPKVMCKRCKALIDHPSNGNGTSAMIKHIKGKGCQRVSKSGNIKDLIEHRVCNSLS